jgi:hypothetical protein
MVLWLTGCTTIQSLFQNPNYLYDDGMLLVDGTDNPIVLENKDAAVDVSFADLLAFIRSDSTDQIPYIDRDDPSGKTSFVCSDFAETLHNRAEVAGIKAGYVSLEWENGGVGHAINVFATTDVGLVYIDCTGRSRFSQVENEDDRLASVNWDKVAYLQIGLEYGVIGIDYATSPDYSYYTAYNQKWQEYKQKLADYNAEVKLYNQEIKDKVFRTGSAELKRILEWEKQLNSQEEELKTLNVEIGDARFKPLGIVGSFNIHW